MQENFFRIGATRDLLCQPLLSGFVDDAAPKASDDRRAQLRSILFDSATTNAERTAKGELDAALIGPIEYARNSSEVLLYPSIGVVSSGQSATIILCIKKESRSISTVAVGNVSASDVVLSTIILSERFEQKCAYVPVAGDIHAMLEKADAALLAGDSAINFSWDGPKLDLIDEWTDLTDLPYVHLVCAGQTEKFSKELASFLVSSKEKGLQLLRSIAAKNAQRLGNTPEQLEMQLLNYQYDFDETSKEALEEFFRYAFYHGILPDIADIKEFQR